MWIYVCFLLKTPDNVYFLTFIIYVRENIYLYIEIVNKHLWSSAID